MDEAAKLRYRLGKLTNRRTGLPFATWAMYGHDDKVATKVVVGVFADEKRELELRRWVSADVRNDTRVIEEALNLLEQHGVRRVVAADRLLGCPHEEGVDYEGEFCPDPACAFWAGRDRWTGEKRD